MMADMPIALGSACRSTRRGISARRMGVWADEAAPKSVAIHSNHGNENWLPWLATPASSAINPCRITVTRSPLRGFIRSATIPKTGERIKVGKSIRPATTPTHKADCVNSQALQPSKNRTIQLPNVDRQLDGKKRRNSGCEKADSRLTRAAASLSRQ